MATISNLDVNLVANTKKFDSRIEKSGRKFGGFAKKISSFSGAKFVGGIAAMVGTVGGILSVAVALRKVNAQFDRIDHIAKFSDEVGATIMQMQALNLQAELTGTSQTTLEKGIQRFTRRLGEANKGMGEGLRAFDAFGLSAEELSKMTLTEQMGAISDKIRDQATQADKAALAYGLFGRQGQELMNFFEGGRAGIEAAADDIDRFGVGLTRVDAAQVEMANDAFTRLDALVNGVFQKIAVEAAPILTAVVEMFSDGAAEAGGFGGAIETGFMILVDGIGFGIDAFNALNGAVNIWRASLLQAFQGAALGLEKLEKGLSYLSGREFDFGIRGLADELQKEVDAFSKKGWKQLGEGFKGTGSQAIKDRIKEIKNRAQDVADAAPKTIETPTIKPKLVDWGSVASGFAAGFSDQFARLSDQFRELQDAKNQTETRSARPSVAALAQGSSAALSIINRSRNVIEDPAAKEIKKASFAELLEMNKQTVVLNQVAKTLKGAATWVGVKI